MSEVLALSTCSVNISLALKVFVLSRLCPCIDPRTRECECILTNLIDKVVVFFSNPGLRYFYAIEHRQTEGKNAAVSMRPFLCERLQFPIEFSSKPKNLPFLLDLMIAKLSFF